MIFHCGITQKERDRRDKEWHSFFPLWPRTIFEDFDGTLTCAWLRPIERRAVYIGYFEGRYVLWEYRLPGKPNRHDGDVEKP